MSNQQLKYFEKQAEVIVKYLFEKLNSLNYILSLPVRGEYNFSFRVKKNSSIVNVVVYFGKKGNKIVLQGNQKSELYEEISKLLNEYEVNHSSLIAQVNEPERYIGVDESGKGDFFGPLIIAGFLVTPEIITDLKALKIQDSKELSDDRVAQIAITIKERFKDYYSIVQINPKKYNELYEKIKNLNSLLAWGHARCIENILQKHKVPVAICDKFGDERYITNALMREGRQIELIQTQKAERFIGVAAASILARNNFIEWIKQTEEKLGFEIPKGANEKVKDAARKIAEKFGRDALINFVKIHFKTMREI
ncbi:MAG: ribonuclease HIII [Ignavibacteria bacterium]|nr:ribonuclease HIII [Ignavibacteria bacterium]